MTFKVTFRKESLAERFDKLCQEEAKAEGQHDIKKEEMPTEGEEDMHEHQSRESKTLVCT